MRSLKVAVIVTWTAFGLTPFAAWAEISVEESETLVAEAAGVRKGIELEETRQGPGGTVLHTFSVEESGTEWVVNATDGYVTRWARQDFDTAQYNPVLCGLEDDPATPECTEGYHHTGGATTIAPAFQTP
ncbi:MAG: hypothetical protein GF320_01570 [Armatimonadia bacterium]|nr:hypothetical protein [Armatimonadia bacterium]